MGEPILELGNPLNWEQIYDETFTAQGLPNGAFYPLDPVIMPVLLTSPILALAASSTDARANWRLGYWARQYIAPAGVGFGALETSTEKAFLNRTTIARFHLWAPQYQLRLAFPYWVRSMSVGIWQYTGPVGDSTEAFIQEQIELTRVDLLRLETKIDLL